MNKNFRKYFFSVLILILFLSNIKIVNAQLSESVFTKDFIKDNKIKCITEKTTKYDVPIYVPNPHRSYISGFSEIDSIEEKECFDKSGEINSIDNEKIGSDILVLRNEKTAKRYYKKQSENGEAIKTVEIYDKNGRIKIRYYGDTSTFTIFKYSTDPYSYSRHYYSYDELNDSQKVFLDEFGNEKEIIVYHNHTGEIIKKYFKYYDVNKNYLGKKVINYKNDTVANVIYEDVDILSLDEKLFSEIKIDFYKFKSRQFKFIKKVNKFPVTETDSFLMDAIIQYNNIGSNDYLCKEYNSNLKYNNFFCQGKKYDEINGGPFPNNAFITFNYSESGKINGIKFLELDTSGYPINFISAEFVLQGKLIKEIKVYITENIKEQLNYSFKSIETNRIFEIMLKINADKLKRKSQYTYSFYK